MTKKNKLLNKFLEKPIRKDLSFDELNTILLSFWYKKIEWLWSRVKFFNKDKDDLISLHKPRPWKILKIYQVLEIQNKLKISYE